MAALNAALNDGSRFVGGCVRNTLLGEPVSDIDIATQLKPEETLKALKRAGIRAIPTGIEHGTITAIADRRPFEITSLRRDVETDGRRAVVAFTTSWEEDAQRRDFRMNALYADGEGQLYDPTGGGLADIETRSIVFIGDAEQRLREDHLRNLRFFRFSSWYAKQFDADGLVACARLKDGLKQIAAERIWKEFRRLLEAPNPYAGLIAMSEAGILDVLLPQNDGVKRAIALCQMELADNFRCDPPMRLMSLLPRNSKTARTVSEALRFSNADRDRLLGWGKADDPPADLTDQMALKVWLYRSGKQAGEDVLTWHCADTWPDPSEYDEALDIARSWEHPVFPVKGADLIRQGMSPGPEIGERLADLEACWLANGFSMDGVDLG